MWGRVGGKERERGNGVDYLVKVAGLESVSKESDILPEWHKTSFKMSHLAVDLIKGWETCRLGKILKL